MKRFATAPLCLAIALLSYFVFPGHTWLQQDTQIYAPILEHMRDPSVLRNDMLVQQPHLAYSLYDEIALGARAATGLGFHEIMAAQQIVTRALGVWGLLLLAQAMGLGLAGAATVSAICSLGATIAGPSVLAIEYEPTPRAFAVPLMLCAIGLGARGRYWAAGIAGAAAFLYHPPTAIWFWGLWVLLCAAAPLRSPKREWSRLVAFLPLAMATVVLLIASRGEGGTQSLLGYLSPALETLQRMRASYLYVSMWPWQTILWHVGVFTVAVAAFWRVREKLGIEARVYLFGLPLIGILSMPISWLLLEQWKWAAVPQVQPMRTLLFVTMCAQFLASVAAVRAARWIEAAAWLSVAFFLPLSLETRWIGLAIGLGVAAALTRRWMPAVAVAAFFVLPWCGVVNYPRLHTPELAELSAWARANTAKDSVFLFADAERRVEPGIFRVEALRALYVDWKGGGQINYLSGGFGGQWRFRWEQTFRKPVDLRKYNGLGVQYAVVLKAHRQDRPAVYENGKYIVYKTAQ